MLERSGSGRGRRWWDKPKLKVLFYEISLQVASVFPVLEALSVPIVDDRRLTPRFGEDIQAYSYVDA
jgi:hypothetical protein